MCVSVCLSVSVCAHICAHAFLCACMCMCVKGLEFHKMHLSVCQLVSVCVRAYVCVLDLKYNSTCIKIPFSFVCVILGCFIVEVHTVTGYSTSKSVYLNIYNCVWKPIFSIPVMITCARAHTHTHTHIHTHTQSVYKYLIQYVYFDA